jgi:hypothetical protein
MGARSTSYSRYLGAISTFDNSILGARSTIKNELKVMPKMSQKVLNVLFSTIKAF